MHGVDGGREAHFLFNPAQCYETDKRDGEDTMSANENKTTLVVGLGEVGRPLLTLLQRHKPETIGIDVEP